MTPMMMTPPWLLTTMVLLMLIDLAVGKAASDTEEPKQKCVSGYCLPVDYQKLESPIENTATAVSIETSIMDFLMVTCYTRVAYIND